VARASTSATICSRAPDVGPPEGTYAMSKQSERKIGDTAAPATRHARAGLVDLLAFLGVLVFAGGLALLVDHTGQLSARLAFAGAAGLVAACITAWRRLRRLELRRWRSGQASYHGRRVTVVSTWGVEGRPPPPIEPSAVSDTSECRSCANTWPVGRGLMGTANKGSDVEGDLGDLDPGESFGARSIPSHPRHTSQHGERTC